MIPYHPDKGCELAPSCLNCPFPKCRYDDPYMERQVRWKKRDQAVLEAWRRGGVTVPQLTRRFRVSERTISRILQRAA